MRALVGQLRAQLRALLRVPDDYRVVLGNGGATAFWAIATANLIERRAALAAFGAFGAKFASEVGRAPFLAAPRVSRAAAGELALVPPNTGCDACCYPHNETSTGVVSPIYRPGEDAAAGALVLVDATSIAGAAAVDWDSVDAYYFSPQKVLAADGGLWFAVLSPAAVERAERGHPDRWVPDILSLPLAIENSAADQTLNTPAIATLALAAQQTEWLLSLGGLDAVCERVAATSGAIYDWAEAADYARPFVTAAALRSPVVATVELTGVDSAWLRAQLQANGIVDLGPYRGVGGNQLRIGCFPTLGAEDAAALTACIDYIVRRA